MPARNLLAPRVWDVLLSERSFSAAVRTGLKSLQERLNGGAITRRAVIELFVNEPPRSPIRKAVSALRGLGWNLPRDRTIRSKKSTQRSREWRPLQDLRLVQMSVATIGREETIRSLHDRSRAEAEAIVDAAQVATQGSRKAGL